MNQPAISVRNLSQRYGNATVIHDVSFDVQPGEIFGFIGPNGAGKTTTIRTMATLMEPYAGRIEICGIDVVAEPEEARRVIGYMPDHAGIYERITVAEYLGFFAAAADVWDSHVVDAVIELTDLGALQERLVASLSKGMRQRLQVARVLIHDPQVLILDEPASDLDPRARIEIRDLLLELKELGKTIFLSSHILTELSDVCTSVGIIEQGRLLAAGPIGSLAEQLAGNRVAEFQPQPQPVLTDSPQSVPSPQPPSPQPPSPQHGPPPPIPGTTLETTPAGVPVPDTAIRRLKLRVLGPAEMVRPFLEACPPVRQVDALPGGQLTVRYVGDDRFVVELVRYLVYHGIALVAVEPEQSELERIFMQVTQGKVQ